MRSKGNYAYDDEDSESSSGSESEEFEGTNALQIALRDKEEALVQSALARIRRAQEKGKREVKLNQDELDALKKHRKRMQAAAAKRSSSRGGGGTERRRRDERQMVTIPIPPAEPKSRKKGKGKRDASPPGAAPPGFLVPGPDGATYTPLGHLPQVRGSPTRPRSSTSQHPRGALPPQFYPQGTYSRHFSDGARPPSSSSNSSRRPLPDEDDWVPQSRRSSVASQSQSIIDPFEYQTSSDHSPMPGQFDQGGSRRNASGPPEIAYSSIRRSPPNPPPIPPKDKDYPPTSHRGASDPTLNLRKRTTRPNYNDEYTPSSSEDDSDHGVQVFVEEEQGREKSIARKPVGGGGRRKGKGR